MEAEQASIGFSPPARYGMQLRAVRRRAFSTGSLAIDVNRLGTRHGIVNRGRPGERLLPFSRLILFPASVVGHRHQNVLARGVAAAIGAGDGNCVDASIAVACPLGSK
jgi:hypothetical protein